MFIPNRVWGANLKCKSTKLINHHVTLRLMLVEWIKTMTPLYAVYKKFYKQKYTQTEIDYLETDILGKLKPKMSKHDYSKVR